MIETGIIGARVRAVADLVMCGDLSLVPAGTEGIIDQIFQERGGIAVAWNLPDRPLPPGYKFYVGGTANERDLPRRDWFSLEREGHLLEYIDLVEAPPGPIDGLADIGGEDDD